MANNEPLFDDSTVLRVFREILELPVEEREAALAARFGSNMESFSAVKKLLSAAGGVTWSKDRIIWGDTEEQERAAAGEARRFGRYKVLRRLGKGGMGEVFHAVRDDGAFDKEVALKVLGRHLRSDEFLQRFHRERQILAELEHPNVARILDGGTAEDGTPYYVMELVDGDPINEYCRKKRFGLKERLVLFRQLCDAVEWLHNRRIVHRDLKPSNVLTTPDGVIKLLDFGLAKLEGPGVQLGTLDLPPASGRLLTPWYASPEQVEGRRVHKQSDVFSMGVMLYELLTGLRPGPADGGLTEWLRFMQTKGAPPPSRQMLPIVEQSLPLGNGRLSDLGELDRIVGKSLEYEESQRYQDAGEFGDELARWLEPPAAPAPKPAPAVEAEKAQPAGRVGPHPVWIGIAILLLVVAVASWRFRVAAHPYEPDETVSAAMVELQAEWRKVVELSGVAGARDVDPGKVLAIVSRIAAAQLAGKRDRQAAEVLLEEAKNWFSAAAFGYGQRWEKESQLHEIAAALDGLAVRLGRTPPGFATQLANAAGKTEQQNQQSLNVRRLPEGKPAAVREPKDTAQTESAPEPTEKQRLERQFRDVESKVRSARSVADQVRDSNAQEGYGVHGEIIRRVERMESYLNAARESIDRGELAEAANSLKIANAEAAMVLKRLGN